MSVRIGLIATTMSAAFVVSPFGTGLRAGPARDQTVDRAPFAQQFESHFTVGADHTVVEVSTKKVKILAQSAIEKASQRELTFVEGVETLDTIEAYTEKADGRRIPVPAKNILTQDAAPDLPGIYYRDEKQRTIIFPNVAVGDTLVSTNRRVTAWEQLLGQFAESLVFARDGAYTAATITIDAPASIGLRVKATGADIAETVDEKTGLTRRTISVRPQPYGLEEPGAVFGLDRDAIVLMSTYKSYEDLGADYGRKALPKARVTPEIAALADEITSGIADRRAQAIAIDAWMKKNIRYVGVYLSLERFYPNDAATVLQNRFGDCKDKAILMTALLAAKGIAAEQALIDLGRRYELTDPPTSAFNHVILYLPEFDLYDDPTNNLAAFGVLAPENYDKPVVLASAQGGRVAHTPAMRPEDHTTYSKIAVSIAADGAVAGRTEERNTGAFAADLRASEASVQGAGVTAMARRLLQRGQTPGAGQFDLDNFTGAKDPAVIKGAFALDERFKLAAGDETTVIPIGMLFNDAPGSFLFGSRFNGRKSAFVCYAGRQTEDVEVTVARPFPLPRPPRTVAIDNPVFSYRSAAKLDGRTMTIHREFVSRIDRQVCPPEVESMIAGDLETVRANVSNRLTFASGNAFGAPNGPTSMAAPATVGAAQNGVATEPAALPAAAPHLRAAALPSQPPELTKVVAIGQKLRVEFLYAIEPDCSSMGMTTVRVLQPPQHGRLTVENGQGFTSFEKDNQRYGCNMRKSDGTFVFYEPEQGFAGKDAVTLDIIFPTGQSSRQRYAIDVR